MKFHLKIIKHFFIWRVVKQWNRLLREVVESASVEIFKTQLGTVCALDDTVSAGKLD